MRPRGRRPRRISPAARSAPRDSTRQAAEAHLAGCPQCAARLDELRRVVVAAGRLDDRPPEAELWPGIAARIAATRAPALAPRVVAMARRFSFSLPQLAAAALIVALLSGGSVWWAVRALSPTAARVVSPDAGSGSGSAGSAAGVDASTAEFDVHTYDQAVADLQLVLAHNRNRLDPETVRTVEANLAVIDTAILQARRALMADPSNPYLSGHLAEQMKRKIRVLQRTADAVTADYSGGSS